MQSTQLFLLLFVIIAGIWLSYKSRMNLLQTMAFAEHSKKQLKEAVNNMTVGVEGFKQINSTFEKFNMEQKNKTIQCIIDINKECDLCGNGGDVCPFQKKGGEHI